MFSIRLLVDEDFLCPVHKVPMIFLSLSKCHICPDSSCVYVRGYERPVSVIWIDGE